MRTILPINDQWLFSKDAAFTNAEKISLPHTWNAKDGQDGGNDYYRGTCYYLHEFVKPSMNEGEEAWLEIKGAAHTSEVFLNGKSIARHEGGYSCYRVKLEDLQDKNTLMISCDNSDNTKVYPQKADFTFYGGLYRDVNMIIVPKEHFELAYAGTPAIKVTPTVDLDRKEAKVLVETWQNAEKVTMEVAGMSKTLVSENGHAQAEFLIENVHLWDGLEDPYLYSASASLESGDTVSTRFGCRQFEIDPEKGFILNGRNYPLRGGSRHQDWKDAGNALTIEHHKKDMEIILEMGANTLRLAHYQHAQEFYDLCDEKGLIVWAEIPFITMFMKEGRANTLSQMEELIVQNYNHPSICVWGLSNEITAASAVDDPLLENHRALNELCHQLDPTRPTTMANVFMLEIDSPILEIPDVNSYNLYFGWYLGELSQNDEFFDEYHAKYPNRCIGFSEYGADANPAYQSPKPEKGDYTESYQCVYHEHILKMLETRPWIWSSHAWNIFDFAADGRDEGGKHGENQKGLVTFDRKTKKDAFYLYKAYWNQKEPFVHIAGGRYVDRTEAVTEIKVYSNQDTVSLYVDSNLFETQKGEHVFRFMVPINGEHSIHAVSGECHSTILVRKVTEANPEYRMVNAAPVNNWFDALEIDETCYSVADKLSDIRMHKEAGAVIDAMMAKMASSRGDVADSVKDNPALQRMMGRMTLISLLKQGGADEETIKSLNRILQRYKKEA